MIMTGVLAILIFIFFLFFNEERFQWLQSYRADSDQPYGTMFMHKLLETYRPGQEFIVSKSPLRKTLAGIDDPENTDYVLIGQNIFLDQESKAALVKFMENGGDAFIATLVPPEDLLYSVYFQECGAALEVEDNRVDSVNLYFFHDSLKGFGSVNYAFRFMTEDHAFYWNYYDERIFCDSTQSIIPLGYQDSGNVNFIRISAGRGNLYLHSNPLVFTNYFLTERDKLGYASAVFSHLDGRDIIWDEFSKIPYLGNQNAYDSPLYYIMQQPSLKYAWWMMLFAVILYVVFGGKRKQRPIPVVEEKSNTSLEFVNMISRLYYKNGNHADMAHKKMKYFLYFVRSRYGIHAEKFKDEHIRRLSEKSRVRFRDVEVIFMQYSLIEDKFRDHIEVNRLVDLYDAIEHFYKSCK